ncbi:MAG: serine/threonine protein kinase, partial [Malacoplasma sp.]|nr:serine/threonine protein kinase [Malacoplasma sp.]
KSKQEKPILPELEPGTILCEFYKVIQKIDTGGMSSVVYLVQSTNDNNYYVAKVIYKTDDTTEVQWDAFLDEVVTSGRVKMCPNVVHTYANESTADRIVMVMDYIDGSTLRDILSQANHLSIEETLYIFKKIALALESLHGFKHKIIHQDLKPENIMLSKDRSDVKIIDFGIANVFIKDDNGKRILTKKEDVHGTFAYICPDLVKSLRSAYIRNMPNTMDAVNQVVEEQLDFYAFGVMLYETLMGHKPFYAPDYTKKEVMDLPLLYDVPIMSKENPKIPTILDDVVFRCMASKDNDVKHRYKSAREIIADLDEAKRQLEQPNISTDLIKPASERTFQPSSNFNFKLEKTNAKFYSSKWFFFLVCFIFAAIIVALVTVIITNKI